MYLIVPAVVILFLLVSALRILNEYERGVIFTLGRYTGTKGPGIIFVIPFILSEPFPSAFPRANCRGAGARKCG